MCSGILSPCFLTQDSTGTDATALEMDEDAMRTKVHMTAIRNRLHNQQLHAIRDCQKMFSLKEPEGLTRPVQLPLEEGLPLSRYKLGFNIGSF